MLDLIDTPAIDAARRKLLQATTQGNRFDIAIATEGLIKACLHAALAVHTDLAPQIFEERKAETSTEAAKRERADEMRRRDRLLASATRSIT